MFLYACKSLKNLQAKEVNGLEILTYLGNFE